MFKRTALSVFDSFNVSLVDKSFNFLKKNLTPYVYNIYIYIYIYIKFLLWESAPSYDLL